MLAQVGTWKGSILECSVEEKRWLHHIPKVSESSSSPFLAGQETQTCHGWLTTPHAHIPLSNTRCPQVSFITACQHLASTSSSAECESVCVCVPLGLLAEGDDQYSE